MDLLSLEAVAGIPASGWATRVLAGAIAYESPKGGSNGFPDSALGVQALAQAVARGGQRWRMRFDRAECGFVLSPTLRCPQLDREHAYTLVYAENQLGYALRWVSDEEPEVFWFDEEDGTHRAEGGLERWCNWTLGNWLLAHTGEDVEPTLVLDEKGTAKLLAYLRVITEKRHQLRLASESEVARLETEIAQLERDDTNADSAYEHWVAASDRLRVLSRVPWPTWFDDSDD